MHSNGAPTSSCLCGHEPDGHYRGRGVCLRTSCPCQRLRQAVPAQADPRERVQRATPRAAV